MKTAAYTDVFSHQTTMTPRVAKQKARASASSHSLPGVQPLLGAQPADARPPGEPTLVHLTVDIYKVRDIDTLNGSAYVEFQIQTNWRHDHLGEDLAKPLPPNLWTPRLRVRQAKDMIEEVIELKRLASYCVGADERKITKCTRFRGTVHNTINSLEDFPFDTDSVNITLEASQCSEGLEGQQVNRCLKNDQRLLPQWSKPSDGKKKAPKVNMLMGEVDMEEFEILGVRLDMPETNGSYDQVQLSIHICRNASRTMWGVVFPLALVVVFNILGLFLTHLADRLNHHSALLLTVLAILFIVHSEMPKTRRQTAIDKLIRVTLVSILITAVHSVVESELYGQLDGGEGAGLSPARAVGAVHLVVYIVVGISILLPAFLRQRRVKRWCADAPIAGKAFPGRSMQDGTPLLEHCERVEKDPGTYTVPKWLQRSPSPIQSQ